MNKKDIIGYLGTHRKELQKRFNLSKIGIFGSYALDCQNENSDIDIIVEMPSDFDAYYDLKELLERQFNKKVDLGLAKNIRPLVKEQIDKEVIYV